MTEEQERAARLQIERDVYHYLTQPRPRRTYSLRDHWWDYTTLRCVACRITLRDFHAVPYGNGLPCRRP